MELLQSTGQNASCWMSSSFSQDTVTVSGVLIYTGCERYSCAAETLLGKVALHLCFSRYLAQIFYDFSFKSTPFPYFNKSAVGIVDSLQVAFEPAADLGHQTS